MLALAYALLVACFTVLPSRLNSRLLMIDIDGLVNPRLVGRLAVLGAALAALMLAASAWRRRRVWMPRLSWPLLAWLALCLIGLAMLVLISQPPWFLAQHGLGEVAWIPRDFDARHSMFYVGFAVVVALAWRDRVSLPALGGVLMAYGCLLELAQEFVPTRIFLLKDLVSNGAGILLGLGWVYLYDALFGEQRTRRSRPAQRGAFTGERAGAALVRACSRADHESGRR